MEKSTEKPTKSIKKTTLDANLPDSIKEKSYITKQVDTSISILESPENDVVLESLLFLSKYADIKLSNLTYLQQKGITTRLLNLLDRNICILRLALRLLGVLLENTSIICEFDQEMYDEQILEICNSYINHKDQYIREFCVHILSKLAKSCRITCLIFKVDLFAPILETIRNSKSVSFLIATMNFLNHLLESPAALGNLLAAPNFDANAIVVHLSNEDAAVAEKAYEIIIKVTSRDIRAFQKIFRDNQLVEKMMDVVMDPNQKTFHLFALKIIQHCANSEETSTYYIKSIQFLSFCQWVKNCAIEYLLPCTDIFEKLSGIPSIKQILYDLSVEESLLSFLRSKEKIVLNNACKAITNMTVHKYCCDDMLTPAVLSKLLEVLKRKDDHIDPANEVVLETIYSFFVRSTRAITLLYANDFVPILLGYFTKVSNLSEESYLRVTEMLYKFSIISDYQHSVVGEIFFEKLLTLLDSQSDDLALLSLEILVHFIGNKHLNNMFLSMDGPSKLLDKLKSTSNTKVLRFLLLFAHNSMLFEKLAIPFLKAGMLSVLKGLPTSFLAEAPIVGTIINLAYNVHLPMKFYETGKLDLTDKLGNKFYIVHGRISGSFPFIEILEAQKVCTVLTLYVVDYTYVVKKMTCGLEDSIKESKSSRGRRFSDESIEEDPCVLGQTKHFGELSSDKYLPRYIDHVSNSISDDWSLEGKIQFLARYVEEILCGPIEDDTMPGKIHNFKLHLENLKFKLCTNLIPIGFLRIGFHCERSLLFKAIADRVNIPCTLERKDKLYWNVVALLEFVRGNRVLKFYIVDLMNNVGTLLSLGSREANKYLRNPTH